MKRLIPIALLLAVLMSGCGLSDQYVSVKEHYIDPAVNQAQTGIVPTVRPSAGAGPNVITDRSKLLEKVTSKAIFSRLSGSLIDELNPSASYGRLLSFDNMLLTTQGKIVLDNVYSIQPLSYVTAVGDTAYADMYVLYNGSKYALCGYDGSWITDFKYSEILGMPLGALCIQQLDVNHAVCYSKDGSLVFDTINFAELYLLSSGSIESLTDYSNGYMRCVFTNNKNGFISTTGAILNRHIDLPSYFDEALTFSEGLAAVCNGGFWGYLNTDGSYAIERSFTKAGSFSNGIAAVVKDGYWSIIDKSGEVKKQFADASEVLVESGYIMVDGEYYSASTFEPAVFYGYDGLPCEGGFWVQGENGVRVFLSNGNQVYFSGATKILDRSGELWSVELADGTYAIMDVNSRVVIFGETKFIKDAATGETYIWSYANGLIYKSSGSLLASNCAGFVVDGYALCIDGLWQGWKSVGDEWMFRIPVCEID